VFLKIPTGFVVSILLLAGTIGTSHAQQRPTGGPNPSPPGASVYFVGLKDGQTVPTTFTVNFGLKGMGVAPAGSDKANSGHHHLLIDTELPPLDQPIPSDFNHLHFGAGQTEAEVTLPEGEHTLQLVLGDKDHIPNTIPLISERIKVRVVAASQAPAASSAPAAAPTPSASSAGRKKSPAGAKVYFVYPTNRSYVSPTPVIRFGLIGMGVAPAGFEKLNTGHHHLLVDTELPPLDQPIPSDFNHLHFGAGQTEAKITLPVGRHTLQLLLADENHVPHDPPVMSEEITVMVTASGKPPSRKKRHRRYRRWD
jgi:Domain of unknown function (DUF4399)